MNTKSIASENKFFNLNLTIVIVIYLVSDMILQWYYRYEGFNANTIGYFSVALEYARGNFRNAVNGFYPPLISWLLVPFIKLGVTPLVAMRILNLITGLFILIGVKIFSYRFDISERIRNIVLFSLVPIVLYYTTYLFPDLLALCFLVYYLNIVFDSKYPDIPYKGLLCGILGALAYFSKHYALPFFIAHFLLLNALHLLKSTTGIKKKNILRNALAGILVFSFISGIWVYLISSKYNYFTIGTAGDYVLKLIGTDVQAEPEFGASQDIDPVYYVGLLEPTYETSLSAWDDPTYVVIKYLGNKAKFLNNAKYMIMRVAKSTRTIIQTIFVNYFSFLSIPIIIVFVLFCIQPISKLILRGDILYSLATLVLYSIGLTPSIIHVDNIRYFWIINILLLLMGGQVLTILFRNDFFGNIRKNILIIVFILSFTVMPLRDIFQKSDRGEGNHILSQKIAREYNIQGSIASNDNWGYTLELVYSMNLGRPDNRIFYYGMPKKNQSNEALIGELNTYKIDYYFVWGESEILPNYKDITEGGITGLRIYSLNGERG